MTIARRLLGLGAMALLGATAAAHGEGTGLYLDGALGYSSTRYDITTFNATSGDAGYEAGAGFRLLDTVGGELNFVQFPRAIGGIAHADTSGVGASILGFLPIPLVDVFARVGLFNFRTAASSPSYSFTRSGSNVMYGVGAGMKWGPFGARVQYEAFNVPHASSMNLTSIGVTYFLF